MGSKAHCAPAAAAPCSSLHWLGEMVQEGKRPELRSVVEEAAFAFEAYDIVQAVVAVVTILHTLLKYTNGLCFAAYSLRKAHEPPRLSGTVERSVKKPSL